jgi:hypothetical protein
MGAELIEARLRVLKLRSSIAAHRVQKRDGRAGRDGDGDGITGEASELLQGIRDFTITDRDTLDSMGGDMDAFMAEVAALPLEERQDIQRRFGIEDWELAGAAAAARRPVAKPALGRGQHPIETVDYAAAMTGLTRPKNNMGDLERKQLHEWVDELDIAGWPDGPRKRVAKRIMAAFRRAGAAVAALR